MKKSLIFVAAASIAGLAAGADAKKAEMAAKGSPTQKSRRGSFDFDKALQKIHSSFQDADDTDSCFCPAGGTSRYTRKGFLKLVGRGLKQGILKKVGDMQNSSTPDCPTTLAKLLLLECSLTDTTIPNQAVCVATTATSTQSNNMNATNNNKTNK